MTLSFAMRKLSHASTITLSRLHPQGLAPVYLAAAHTRLASNIVEEHVQDKKQAQENRAHIDRQSDENVLSGTDDAVAMEPEISYDRGHPANVEDAKELASRVFGSKPNPLEVSAANPDVSETVEGEHKLGVKESPETSSYHGATPAKSSTSQAQPDKKIFAGSNKRNSDVTEARPSKYKNRPVQT